MIELEKLAFKELDRLTNEIAEKFFYAQKMCDSQNHLLAETNEKYDYFAYIILKIKKAYESLNELERNLINNEFFFQNYSSWWRPLYSRATFYRFKKEAMKKFLGAIYA